jgi:hypothetical protein
MSQTRDAHAPARDVLVPRPQTRPADTP